MNYYYMKIYNEDDEKINEDDLVASKEIRDDDDWIHVLEVDPTSSLKLPVFCFYKLDEL